MNNFILEIENEIDTLNKAIENDFTLTKSKDTKQKVDNISKKIDNYLNETQEDKLIKAKLYYLKGKSLDFLEEYSKEAEDSLSKSLKLNPKDTSTWNILGDILWKKKDYPGAKKTFEAAIEQCGKNKVSLRSLSMIMRCLEDCKPIYLTCGFKKNRLFNDFLAPKERTENVKKSVELAKSSVALDLNDGESWYILGNAYLSDYFVNVKKLDVIQSALKAYNQAESKLTKNNPDLYYNRGIIQSYLEDFDKAIQNFEKADGIDPNLNAKSQITKIFEVVKNIESVISNKGKIKPKVLSNVVKSIPSGLKTQPKHLGNVKYEIKGLDDLKVGLNSGVILSCKITNVISNKGEVPSKFIFVDFKSSFGNLSIYHCNNDIYDQVREQTDIYVVDPELKEINTIIFDRIFKYKSIQVFNPESIYIDSQKIPAVFSPSEIVNITK